MKKTIALIAVGMMMAFSAFAEEGAKEPATKKAHPEVTAEQRTKMAEAHEKMAACLRSTRPFSECHEEMAKFMKDHMGKDGCPMMGHGKHKGHGHHGEKADKGPTDTTM